MMTTWDYPTTDQIYDYHAICAFSPYNLLDTARRMGLRYHDHPRGHAAAWLSVAASFRLSGDKEAAREAIRRAAKFMRPVPCRGTCQLGTCAFCDECEERSTLEY